MLLAGYTVSKLEKNRNKKERFYGSSNSISKRKEAAREGLEKLIHIKHSLNK